MMSPQTRRITCPERICGSAPIVTGSMDIGTAGHKIERAEKAVIKKTNIYRDDSMKNFFKNITARKVLQICSWGLLLCIGNYVINDVGVSFLSPDIRHILRAAADIVIFVAACCGIRNCYTTGKELVLFKNGIAVVAASVIGAIVWFAFIFMKYSTVADMLIQRADVFYLIHILWSLGYFFAARRVLTEKNQQQ